MSSPPPSSGPLPPSGPGAPFRRPGVARHAAKAEPDDYGDDLEPPAPSEIRRSATVLRLVLVALGLAGVGTVAALGGFERAGVDHGLAVAHVNELIRAGTWEMTVESATAGGQLRGVEPDDGDYLIEVVVAMTNRRDQTAAVFGRLVPDRVDGLDSQEPKQHKLVRDNQVASYLQPGLTERVAFIWEIKRGTPVPREMNLEVWGTYPRRTSFVIVNSVIAFDEQAATVAVPVIDRTARS